VEPWFDRFQLADVLGLELERPIAEIPRGGQRAFQQAIHAMPID
jgi:hypothetical protein